MYLANLNKWALLAAAMLLQGCTMFPTKVNRVVPGTAIAVAAPQGNQVAQPKTYIAMTQSYGQDLQWRASLGGN